MIKATYFGRLIGWLLVPLDDLARSFLAARRARYPRHVSPNASGYLAHVAIAGKVAIEAHNAGVKWSL